MTAQTEAVESFNVYLSSERFVSVNRYMGMACYPVVWTHHFITQVYMCFHLQQFVSVVV